MKILRQNLGIDIAKDSFVASFTVLLEGQIVKHKGTKLFKNNTKGFDEFLNWSHKFQDENVKLNFTMEATGVYYESLAYYLFGKNYIVHVLLPNKAKKFAESLNIKSKTDKIDSRILGQMGVERQLEEWILSSKIFRKLKTITRERQRLVEQRTMIKNQLHAEEHTAEPEKSSIRRMKNHIRYINGQIEKIENELKKIVASDNYVSEKIDKITTIPGVGFLTAVTIVGEAQGFDNFSSIKQLNSYAGYDIVLKESGNLKGKTRISKKGNTHMRRALYMPSISTSTRSKTFKNFHDRLDKKKRNGLIVSTAVQRKLLGLIYTLWKNDTEYIENYESKKVS